MCPPCADTIARAMNKPSPMLCDAPSARPRASGSKTYGSTSGGIGGPPLWTVSVTELPCSWPESVMGVPLPCCIALPTRFDTTCPSRSASHSPRRSPLTCNCNGVHQPGRHGSPHSFLADLLKVCGLPFERK